jgi:hypothetical protein
MKIPPEIDRLMWAVAEANDPKALDDFEARYPMYRYELGKRLSMLRGLRGARPTEAVRVFEPRYATSSPLRPRWVYAVGALCLASLAVASYFGTALMLPRNPKPIAAPLVRIDPPRVDGGVEYVPAPENPTPQVVPVRPRIDPVPQTPAYLKPQNLQLDEAPLQTALQLLAAQSGLRIEFAPGMANPKISIDYRGQSAIEILKDMGEQFGFTAFDQGDRSVLVVPAVEKEPLTTSPKRRPEPSEDHPA